MEREFQVEINNKPCGGGHKQGDLVSMSKQGFNDDRERKRGQVV